METFIDRLPVWALLVVCLLWITWKELGPRINRGRAPSQPPSVSGGPAENTTLLQLIQAAALEARDAREESRERDARFERALDAVAESDRRLLEAFERAENRDRLIVETLQEMRAALRALATTQDAILRRLLEDTGRFNLPRGG